MGSAHAGRKRIVVLDFEGPKAEKFHSDVVKLIKKSHTVLSVDKWNEKADELGADAVTDKNIKKVAKKLKIDGVVTGRIEKRRDEYILRLKLRSGVDGSLVGSQVQTKSESARLDAQAQRDIKDELLATIEELDSNRGGGDEEEEEAEEEEEEAPKKGGFGKKGQMSAEEPKEDPKALAKKKKAEEEEAKRLAKEEEKRKKEEEKLAKEAEEKRKKDEALAKKEEAAAKKKKADDDAALASKKAQEDAEAEEDEEPRKKKRSDDDEEDEDGGRKRTASRDDDEEAIEDSADVEESGGRDLSVAGRAIDAVLGMSFTARQLKFTYQMDLGKPPPGYKQSVPVAGAIFDATIYPLAFGKTKGIMRGIGLNVMYDQVLLINSQKRYSDEQGVQQVANLSTKENRWAVGPVLRYPMGKAVVGGSLTYGSQQFTIAQTLPNDEPTDIPNVKYTMITPAAFVRYSVTPKIVLNADLAFHGVTNTGQIQQSGMTGYGAATVTAFGVEGGGDYMVTKNIFARASVRYESFGIKFKGDPTSQTNLRDTDPEQDVTAAKDTYFGGTLTVGYAY